MGRKSKILTEFEIENIIKIYQNEIISVETLAKKFGVGKIKIKKILDSNNIPIRKRGCQKTIGNSTEIENSKIKRYKSNNKKLIAVCKKTGKQYKDINNLSGTLTEHILSEYGDVPVPTNTYQRKKYEITHGKKWFEEYFDIKEIEKDEIKKCPYCNWKTTDIENKSGAFQIHLYNEHNITINEYIKTNPNEINYFKKYKKNIELIQFNNHIVCEICGNKLKYLTNTHLLIHGISTTEYKLRFPNSPIISQNYKNKLIDKYNKTLKYHENKFSSKPQLEIYNYIKSLGVNVKLNDKKLLKGVEIDILIDDFKLGIEYNGLYYHTEKNGKSRQAHLTKTKLMNLYGYNLIQIFEDEWLNNKILIKNKIKHILDKNNDSNKIGARKCKIQLIDNQVKNSFLNLYHTQGSDKSIISYGAYYDNILVGVMTFNNIRGMTSSHDNIFELTRFATNYNYIIAGLASKIIKKFINDYKPLSIISFGDICWVLDVNDNLYTKLGFKLVNILPPDYKYYNPKINRHKRLHKFGFGKTSLKKKYPHLDYTKTEKELTSELGFHRIWNCGLFKYELNLKNE